MRSLNPISKSYSLNESQFWCIPFREKNILIYTRCVFNFKQDENTEMWVVKEDKFGSQHAEIWYTLDFALYCFCRLPVESVYVGVLNSDSFFLSLLNLKNRFGTISRGKAEKPSKFSRILLVDVYMYPTYQLIFRFLNGKKHSRQLRPFKALFLHTLRIKGMFQT